MNELELLRRVPLFSDMEQEDLAIIRAAASLRRLPRNSVLFCEGDPGETLFLVLSGKVKATLTAEDGREVTLSHLGPGDIVGEMALFDMSERRSATVSAVSDCELLAVSGETFLRVVEENASIAKAVIRTLTTRLRETSSRIAGLVFLEAYRRLWQYLLDLSEKEGRVLADKSVLIERPTHQDIANYIGSSRETVSRMLKDLEHQKLIRVVGRKIILFRGGRN
ncbi:MAG: Crp/Fnr family transcriptional regulator [Acidobacteriota bacterium]